ncbi:putative methyltransferase At1g27930 [Senna tora]|uniref:Putative methyltransferase At1g27930 n=1 Tax=Senna tora TaxID=362788 RepID=A0A834W2C5_9FABA|nr:putative methyltransferase At1g27930 [Senna tora]
MQYSWQDTKRKYRHTSIGSKPKLVGIIVVATLLLIVFFSRSSTAPPSLCFDSDTVPLTEFDAVIAAEFNKTASPLVTVLYYATLPAVPELSLAEIRAPYDILLSLAPCNFLIFGTGHDSLMWDSFNPHGTTLFLEEDPKWTYSTLRHFPILNVHTLSFATQLSDAPFLLLSYNEDCWGGGSGNAMMRLKGNKGCKLALSDMPDEVYDRDWDVIMIDGPRGYYAEAPGRMAVIYSAAVMARARKRSGVTHVFVHDMDRKVERRYAEEFLCMKYKVSEVGRLWHFAIPPAFNINDTSRGFCS